MGIYRGPGGSGDATNDASSETRLAVEARDAAIAAQLAAEAAQAAAETAETNAETAETNAETAETNAETAATSAASSASTATTKASEASISATNAASSASAASTSATNAASSASAASTSASNASTSATNAASSASSASTSATSAASSASSASTSASTATTKASEASTSATNAATSASSASSSASTATTQAGIATTKASEASTSATNAASSASSASTSATNAASSATTASTQATNAATSATAAQSAQTAAESARDAALSAYDNFDDRYLGPKSSDPTLDNDGNALVSGALYFNTATNVMKVYDGSTWVAAYVSAAGVLLASNNLSDLTNTSTARTNLGVAIGTNVQAWDADLDTWATKTAPSGTVVGTSDTQTLTNKTISGASNTLSNIGNSSLTNSSITIGGSAVSLGGTVGTLGVGYGGTGLTSLTAGYIPFGAGTSALGNSANLFWDSVNNRLGIGTTTPANPLSVYASVAPVISLQNSTTGQTSSDGLALYVVGNTAYIDQRENGSLNFLTNATERMRIDSSGNVGIGTSSPDVFSRGDTRILGLSSTGSVAIAANAATGNNALLQLGSNNVRNFQIQATTSSTTITTGNPSATEPPLVFGCGFNEYMRLTPTGLGIGTSSPSGILHLSTSTGTQLYAQNTGTAYSWARIENANSRLYVGIDGNTPSLDTGNAPIIWGYSNYPMIFGVNNAKVMTLSTSGNLGLGVTPSAWGVGKVIEVGATGNGLWGVAAANTVLTTNSYYNGAVWKYANNGYASYYQQELGKHIWFNAASGTAGNTATFTQAMTLDASGNLGIGTSSPSYRLNVLRSGNGYSAQFSNGSSTVSVYNGSTTSYVGDVGTNNAIAFDATSNYVALSTNNTERMRIDSSGNLLVGTTSSTIGSDNGLVAAKRATSGYSMILGSAQTGSISYMIKFTYDNTTGTGQISTTNTTVSYATSSDYRLKENVATMTGALNTVAALKPVTYNWKVDGSDGQGFIAHELAEVIPDAVVGEKDVVDADGNPVYQAVDTSFLVATLTAAIQEQQAIINDLKARIETLENK